MSGVYGYEEVLGAVLRMGPDSACRLAEALTALMNRHGVALLGGPPPYEPLTRDTNLGRLVETHVRFLCDELDEFSSMQVDLETARDEITDLNYEVRRLENELEELDNRPDC